MVEPLNIMIFFMIHVVHDHLYYSFMCMCVPAILIDIAIDLNSAYSGEVVGPPENLPNQSIEDFNSQPCKSRLGHQARPDC